MPSMKSLEKQLQLKEIKNSLDTVWNIDEKVNFNEQDFNTLKSLMSRRNKPLKFPLGHFVRYLYKGKFRDQVEEEEKEKQEEDLKNVYIEKRFYNVVEIGFIFWFLIFRKDFTLAKLLAENERQYIEPFLDKMAKIIGVKKIKLLLNKSLSKMVSYPQGLKWGLLEAIKYKMDQFATEQLEVYEFLKSDKEFMLEMKELSAKFKCIRMLQLMYKDFFSPSYQLNFYEEITTKLSSGDTKKYVKKDDAEVKEDNIQILEVFHQKIKKYEIKIKNEHQKYKSYESNREINMTTSSGEEDYQEKELQKIRKNIEDYQNERDQLEQEMKYIISTPYYLENVNLTSELIKYQAYYVIPHLFRERIKVRECIEDHQIFIDDFKMILNLWDKFSFYVIYEISLKLLEKEENILALYPPDSQKNIVKLILTRVYIGSELLSRIKIQKWNQKFNKDLLSAIEQHCKDPNHIIYCQKPMLAICLLIEFIEKLMQNTKQQRNKCIAISQQLLNIGGKFVKELKDAEMVKFFSSQKDSRGRSALVIMSIKHFYTMLESPQMALIIKEQWHGPSSQCFGTYEMCSTYKISMSLYGYDEARRRFNSVLFDKKSYQFQYYIWPDSCSARRFDGDNFQYADLEKNSTRFEQDTRYFAFVWLKITNFVLAIQQFGIYVRMFRHMLVVLINFMILFFLWVACASLIFTVMFYNDSLEFQSYFQSFLNLYNGGLTNFDNKPPFNILSFIFMPILIIMHFNSKFKEIKKSMKKRTNRMFTKQELKEQQREEDFKENKNMDNKQRFNLFIEREELRIFSKTLKYYNDYFINKDKTEQVVSSTTEKLVNIKEKFMKQWEQIRKIDKQNLEYKKLQETMEKNKQEFQRQVVGHHQSKTSQYYFSNEASHEQALLIDKQIDKEPRKPAIKVQAVVGKLTYFKDPANQPEMSKKIVRITENFMNVMSINKQTMEEFILWLSNIENFLDIDKMRKVIYDEQIIEDMNDQDFEEYRQRLFNTKTTFFDKAIEKSSKKITNDFAEIQYANDIASNLEDINTQFKYLKKKMTRIFIFMQLVKPDGLQFKEDLFGSHDEKSHVRAASEIISKHASELRRQKRKKREAKDKEDQNNKFFEYEKQKLQLTNPYSIRL
ncbi:UNKNOWN [Stylonychia lemnae]|uniref:Uncharacterized protein n=1 Tax=Stylonychia lemnae TaxID=5949 RepID=A0A078AXY1_STYLE|nr:UNKNOWN [Stylonychia lemnae]|eukprot:CDW85648.1 UNKNOWN [Stylonychia lemnae]